MASSVYSLFVVTGWAVLVGLSGAAFAFGVATVCRWMKWAPININVTINNYQDGETP